MGQNPEVGAPKPPELTDRSRLELDRPVHTPEVMGGLDPSLIAAMPPFLRQLGARLGQSNTPAMPPGVIAYVNSMAGSRDIHSENPSLTSRPTIAHELTHVLQNQWQQPPRRPALGE